ncbi:hypothetical protein V8G54_037198, partial [Vigna mungo]
PVAFINTPNSKTPDPNFVLIPSNTVSDGSREPLCLKTHGWPSPVLDLDVVTAMFFGLFFLFFGLIFLFFVLVFTFLRDSLVASGRQTLNLSASDPLRRLRI